MLKTVDVSSYLSLQASNAFAETDTPTIKFRRRSLTLMVNYLVLNF